MWAFFYGEGFFKKEKPLCHFICLLMVLRARPTHKLPRDFYDEYMLNLLSRYRTEIACLCWSVYVLVVLGYFGFRQALLGFMCIG
jgi:hypothetical protein